MPRQTQAPAPTALVSLNEFLTTGINPLVQAATPLLVLAGRLRGQISQADVEALRRQTMQEVRAFEDRARQAGCTPEDVIAARYALCTAIDEAVLQTPWGYQGGWAAQSLLVTFHREASGGEKFFQILDRTEFDPRRYLALLELLYVCLALGFEGKFRLQERGTAQLLQIKGDLYQKIQSVRGAPEPELSPHWQGIEDKRNAVLRFVPLWVVAAASAALLIGAYIYFSNALTTAAEPLNALLARVGLEEADAAAAPAAAAPNPDTGLRAALAGPLGRGLIRLDESGGKATITLTSADLFGSGSARINDHYVALLHEIGATLERFPGRIRVIGHTDDRPIHSLEYRDNYELSRDRAQHVADLLRTDIKNAARVDSTGLGPSMPLYTPADDPANQARNRRVEVVFLPQR
jgi:type VI secretion system protein ImpK